MACSSDYTNRLGDYSQSLNQPENQTPGQSSYLSSSFSGTSASAKIPKQQESALDLSPEIVFEIFNNLEFENLKIYRGVSKTWDKTICAFFAHKMNGESFRTQKKLCRVLIHKNQYFEVVEKVVIPRLYDYLENSPRGLAIELIKRGHGYEVMKKTMITEIFNEDFLVVMTAGYLAKALLKEGQGHKEVILAAIVMQCANFHTTAEMWEMLFKQGQGQEEAKALARMWLTDFNGTVRDWLESSHELHDVLIANGQEEEKVKALMQKIANIDKLTFDYKLRTRALVLWTALVQEKYENYEIKEVAKVMEIGLRAPDSGVQYAAATLGEVLVEKGLLASHYSPPFFREFRDKHFLHYDFNH